MESQPVQKKTVSIPGFTENGRQQELKDRAEKLAKQGWELVEYHDDGFSNSKATFKKVLVVPSAPEVPSTKSPAEQILSFPLALGIFFFPWIFGWFGMRQGYSKEVKTFSLGWMVFLTLFLIFRDDPTEESTPPAQVKAVELSPEEQRKKKLEALFNPWDGSVRALVEVVKSHMNDPDSFKHVKTTYKDKPSYVLVQMTYRGKNAFGGVVTNSIRVSMDYDGNIKKILEQSP